jgi:DNA-binding response OmpR family regulator
LTALDSDDDVWRGWAGGADYYLTKPFDIGQLRRVTERLLAGRHLETLTVADLTER